ncbi:acidic ribosomal protein P1 [Pyrenochaeta sp. MPI-SDFR-AT-0127]|nr:acidic ribosomal protein P1 [Pyrenochaeta sp. MPI-SDFR-AT-0127]
MSTDKAEQAVAYAALILSEDSIAITPEKLQALLQAAGIDDVEPIWTTLFANALKNKDVKEILTTITAPAPTVGGEVPGNERANEKDGEKDGDVGAGKYDDIDIDFGSDDEAFCSMFD